MGTTRLKEPAPGCLWPWHCLSQEVLVVVREVFWEEGCVHHLGLGFPVLLSLGADVLVEERASEGKQKGQEVSM